MEMLTILPPSPPEKRSFSFVSRSLFYITMSLAMSHPNDWAQFYRQISFSGQPTPPPLSNIPGPPPAPDHQQPLDAESLAAAPGSSTLPSDAPPLGNAGRVAKPKRRRTRASRRTPTTLLSTDTSNFRAMVQQFTGGPAAAHFMTPAGMRPDALNINFGLEPGRVQLGPPGMFHGHQHHAADQRPVFGHMQDQAYGGAPPETFHPRPPFMQ